MPSTNFNQPIYPGAKTITVSGTITNVSGSCTQDILDERVAGSMRAIAIDLGTPSIFNAKISVECLAGKVRVTCTDVAGTSTISIVLLKTDDDPTALTSTEFDILNNRMSNLENICTNSNVTIHTTDWVLTNSLYTYTWSNSTVDVNSCVEVYPLDGSESAGIDEFDFTHTTGQVVITTPVQPVADLPIMIRVIHAKLTSMNAEAISTEAVSGCVNVEEALESLDEQIVTRKLLWSNNSPSSDFEADTRYLSESASNFDEIQIYFQEKTGKNAHVQTFSNSFTDSAIFCINGGDTGNHSYDLMTFSRRVDISGTSFYCGNCIYNHGGGSVGFTIATRNDLVVPIYVYGLKYGK